jgi:hypothetical protein
VTFKLSSGVTVSGLSGRYYSITVTDSTHVSVVDSQVHGGKGFAGIAFWRDDGSKPGNGDVLVARNEVAYTTYSGILIAGTTGANVTYNEIRFAGESGIKTGQNDWEQSYHVTLSNNVVEHNWYDGLDLSSTYPHTGTFGAYSFAIGNRSAHNRMTGLYIDGRYWELANNQFTSNGLAGMAMDLSDSSIIRNEATDNNQRNVDGQHQVILGQGVIAYRNFVLANRVENRSGNAGYCMYVSGPETDAEGNTVIQNSCLGGVIWAPNGHDDIRDNTAGP